MKPPFDPENSPLGSLTLLEASAGTGKTWSLEHLVARLVGREQDPLSIDEILVVTFTVRAAREMKSRIRNLLIQRAGDTGGREGNRYRAAVDGFDRASIQTIHGFCRTVLGTWPFESAAPFRQELIPSGFLERREAENWLAGLRKADVDGELMRAAYRHSGTVAALAAGIAESLTDDSIPPGAHVLPTMEESEAFDRFVRESVLPNSPLSLAAEALLSRDWSNQAVKAVFKAVQGPNKRAESLNKIREHMTACRGFRGIVDLSEVLAGDPADVGVRDHFLELLMAGGRWADAGPIENGEAGELGNALARLHRRLLPYVEADAQNKKTVFLTDRYMRCAFTDLARQSVEKRTLRAKDEQGVWGYTDLIRRVADAVDRKNSPLAHALRRRYRAALIDEFQDTDPRQWRLFQKVFGAAGHILVLIGDPKQSIYSFRGTGLQAYNAAMASVPGDGQFRLDRNFRSSPNLVNLQNLFFTPLFQQAYGENDPVGYETIRAGLSGRKRISTGAAPLVLLGVCSETEGAAAIVSEISRLLHPETNARWEDDDGEKRPVRASDIAVLVRRGRAEDDMVECLGQVGIPVQQIRDRSVFFQPAAVLLRGLLAALASPRKISRWRSVLLDNLFSLPPDLLVCFEREGRLDELVERGRYWNHVFENGGVVAALDSFFAFAPSIGKWAEELNRNEAAEPLALPWIERILAEPGGERQWQDWRHLEELIQDRQSAGLRDINGILRWLTEAQGESSNQENSLRVETETPAVSVLTMHVAKGLEFPLVFIHGGYGGKSSRRSRGPYRFDKDGVLVVDRIQREENFSRNLAYAWEEEKRLWYVAFTRASSRIWMPRLRGEGAVTQVESLLYSALGSEENKNLPPHEILPMSEGAAFRAKLDQHLVEWLKQHPGMIECINGGVEPPPFLPRRMLPEPLLATLPAMNPASRDPVSNSYTSLTREDDQMRNHGIEPEILITQAAGNPLRPTEIDVPLSADRGATFGSLVHDLLENGDFDLAGELDAPSWCADAETDRRFEEISTQYYSNSWYRNREEALKKMIHTTLRASVPTLGRICNLEASKRRSEVEFLMTIPQSCYIADKPVRKMENGYLRGFIDLLIQSDGRWWVVDWKTNLPRRTEVGRNENPLDKWYGRDGLEKMMAEHHYHLQYELYLLALCRSLSIRSKKAVDWDKEIGGAAYLFVRGVREEDDRGIYVGKPRRERMLSLSEKMGLEGVLE